MAELGVSGVDFVTVPTRDYEKAKEFYGGVLGLPPAFEGGERVGYAVGQTVLMLKAGWYARPTDAPNPRVTLEVEDAARTERALRERGAAVSDPVARYGEFDVGGFLDSEGNKLWFCSPVRA